MPQPAFCFDACVLVGAVAFIRLCGVLLTTIAMVFHQMLQAGSRGDADQHVGQCLKIQHG
jgi:hypothetical protein